MEWMERVEQVLASTASYHSLQPEEVEIVIEQFKVTLDTSLSTQQMMVMTRATRLLVSVLGEQLSSWVGLVEVLQKLLSSLLALKESEGLNELVMDLVSDCIEDNTMKTMVLEGLARQMLVVITSNNMAHSMRTTWLKLFNMMLTGIKYEVKETIMIENPEEIEQLPDFLQTCGDYDTQSSLVEALIRFTTKSNRATLANTWFLNKSVQELFCKIKIKDFETDCRNFLNGFNKEQGEDQLVFSIPSISCEVDGKQMFKPPDEEYTQLWVDFNLGPGTISLYYVKEEGYTELWDLFTIRHDMVTLLSTSTDYVGNTTIVINISDPNSTIIRQVILTFHSTPSLPFKLSQLLSKVFPKMVDPVPPAPVAQTPNTPGRSCIPAKLLLPRSPFISTVVNSAMQESTTPQPMSQEVLASLPCGQASGRDHTSHETERELASFNHSWEPAEVDNNIIPETPDEECDEFNIEVHDNGEEQVGIHEERVNEKMEKHYIKNKATMNEGIDSEEECSFIPASIPSPRKHRKGWKKVKSKLSRSRKKQKSTDLDTASADKSSPIEPTLDMIDYKQPVEGRCKETEASNVTDNGDQNNNNVGKNYSSTNFNIVGDSLQVKDLSYPVDSSVPLQAGDLPLSPLVKQVAPIINERSGSASSCDSLSGLAKLLTKKPKLCLLKKRVRVTKSPELSQIRESQESKFVMKPQRAGNISTNGKAAETVILKMTDGKCLGSERKKGGGVRKKVFKPWLASRSENGQHTGKGRRSLVRRVAKKNLKRSIKLFSDDEDEELTQAESPLYNPMVTNEVVPTENMQKMMKSCVNNSERPNHRETFTPTRPYRSGLLSDVQEKELCKESSGEILDGGRLEQEVILMWAIGVLDMVSRRNEVEPDLREVWGQIRSIAETQEARE